MKILITGANGFLGYYLAEKLLDQGHEVIATGRGESKLPFHSSKFIYQQMDFTDPFVVHDVFEKYEPGVVIHAGAMSKPDDCEENQWQAYVTNVEGTLNMLINSEEYQSFFIFVSTDFVFDGEKGMYKEDDETHPVNFYGKTKLEAEEAVKEYEHDWAIARTIMVYGKPFSGRDNILSLVKKKLEAGESYSVFDDQERTPTYVEDLVSAIVAIIERKAKGIFHISGTDILTPYQMACKTADFLKLDRSLIKKVTAADLVQPAIRPLKTGFVIDKARAKLGFKPISFEEGLHKTFEWE